MKFLAVNFTHKRLVFDKYFMSETSYNYHSQVLAVGRAGHLWAFILQTISSESPAGV